MALESLLKRDRRIAVAAIAALTMLAWMYLFWLARTMTVNGMPVRMMSDMAGMNMSADAAVMLQSTTAREFAFLFLMWTIMMVGMMTPSAAPMILIYAHVARHSALEGRPLAATGWF